MKTTLARLLVNNSPRLAGLSQDAYLRGSGPGHYTSALSTAHWASAARPEIASWREWQSWTTGGFDQLKIGFLGTGALGTVWTAAGHQVFTAGRSSDNATKAASAVAGTAFAGTALAPPELGGRISLQFQRTGAVVHRVRAINHRLARQGAARGARQGQHRLQSFPCHRHRDHLGDASQLVASLAVAAGFDPRSTVPEVRLG